MSDGDSARGTTFTETMLGSARIDGEDGTRPARLDLRVAAQDVLRPLGTTKARLSGRLRIAGWADDPYVTGEMEISPFARRRIRYRLACTAQGRRLTLDGWKSVSPRHPVRSMTVLPYTLHDGEERVGTGTLRFPLATGLAPSWAASAFRAARTAVGTWRRAGAESPAAPRSGTPPSPTRRPATACGCTTS